MAPLCALEPLLKPSSKLPPTNQHFFNKIIVINASVVNQNDNEFQNISTTSSGWVFNEMKTKTPQKVFNFETAYKRFKCLHVLFATISVALVNTKEDVLWIWNKICVGRWSKTSFLCTTHASLHFFEQRKPSLSGRASQFLEFRLNDIICFNKHLISIFINRAMQQCFGNGIFNCPLKLVLVPLK